MKLVILDRDGVINHESRFYIKSPDEWLPIDGALEAIAQLNAAGYTVVITTNQSGVGRKYFSLADLELIHNKLHNAVEKVGGKISKIYFCPHAPTDGCNCRKPKPGMFEQIENDFNINIRNSDVTYIGDSMCDLLLGINAGCTFFLVTGNGSDGNDTLSEVTPEQLEKITVVKDLAEATKRLLG